MIPTDSAPFATSALPGVCSLAVHSIRALVAFAVAGGVAGSMVCPPIRASAHPFGDPQTVVIAIDEQRPDVVVVKWRVGGPDDLTALGVALGVLPPDRARADGTVDYRYTDPGVVGASERFTRYLLERITVTDGARACTGTVEPVRALDLKGAVVDYACPGPVAKATVAVRMLTDLNPAYRTMATGPTGQRAVYEGADDTHAWTLVGGPPVAGASLGRSAITQLAAVIGGVLLVLVGCVIAARRLHRARRTAPSSRERRVAA
ncbi:hypothetical protein [Micromonospora sp. WMMD812]|uniref:hypothetical protein n=1 Tax=Micromonospora sp. WMMD812 TaxID=3015152 RepID=UPI00248C72A8|nr:hypothetical protein [Micromonospora sp. WMMD812]WBB67690.1 hypothetical protein O7603_32240 [Micromonospora sp. WMMD812]